MPLLFSYGTLQQEQVQVATFGRVLEGQQDELVGFEPSSVRIEDPQVVAASGRTHHANVTFNGRDDSRVGGTVFEITDDDIIRGTPSSEPPYTLARGGPAAPLRSRGSLAALTRAANCSQ
jgi:hypothetical protein